MRMRLCERRIRRVVECLLFGWVVDRPYLRSGLSYVRAEAEWQRGTSKRWRSLCQRRVADATHAEIYKHTLFILYWCHSPYIDRKFKEDEEIDVRLFRETREPWLGACYTNEERRTFTVLYEFLRTVLALGRNHRRSWIKLRPPVTIFFPDFLRYIKSFERI